LSRPTVKVLNFKNSRWRTAAILKKSKNRHISVVNSLCVQVLGSPVWQRYCTALEQWASAKLCSVVQEMELWNFRCSSFSTEGATYIENLYILREAITLGIGPHSSSF